MSNCYKIKVKKTLTLPCTLLLVVLLTFSENVIAFPHHFFHNVLTLADQQEPSDTTKKKKTATDSSVVRSDTFNIKFSKDSLTSPVAYHADDSMVLYVPEKKMVLYGKTSSVKYTDMELKAPGIVYDQQTGMVQAHHTKDSAGNVIATPSFVQGDSKMVSDTIVFNMKTQRGITKGTYTQQGEMYVYGEKIKRADKETFYALNGRFTTCNLDTPHFSFVSRKIKFINQKWAFSGPVHPEFEGVPVPIVLPFGIYPLSRGRHSGLIAPSFTANDQWGMALEGLGYYKILNPTWDVIFRGTLYSYGGWKIDVNPRYYKRYKYQGNFSYSMQKFKPLDEASSRTMNINWAHNSDTKARPGVVFRASVNAGSSKYNSQIPNDPRRNFQNQLQSTIAYSKTWKNKPYNIAINASHNQNNATKLFNINLPDINFNLQTQYPFRRKEPIGEYKWYENLGIGLNTIAKGNTNFYDTLAGIFTQARKNFRYGFSHSVPITLALPPMGPLQVSPSISYSENWYQTKLTRQWNTLQSKIDTVSLQKGLYTERSMAFNLGVSTRIFGMFIFNKSSKIKAIRHELRPTVSASYRPDMSRKNYQTFQSDISGNTQSASVYQGNIFGPFGSGKNGSLNFSLDNIVQMKTRNKSDTSEDADKKITLIDGLRLDASYNFLADSFKLSNFGLSARTNLFEKINITSNAIFDPYQVQNGRRVDKLIWSGRKPFALGTLTSANLSFSSSFKGGEKKNGKGNTSMSEDENAISKGLVDPSGMPLTDYEQEAQYIRNNPSEFVDFDIPWNIDLSYSLLFSRSYITGAGWSRKGNLNQSMNINSSINLTPKWKLGASGSYNITTKEVGVVSAYLSRDMHCWQMSINVSPVGIYRFFSINISPKSSILRDVKVNRTRSFYEQF